MTSSIHKNTLSEFGEDAEPVHVTDWIDKRNALLSCIDLYAVYLTPIDGNLGLPTKTSYKTPFLLVCGTW